MDGVLFFGVAVYQDVVQIGSAEVVQVLSQGFVAVGLKRSGGIA